MRLLAAGPLAALLFGAFLNAAEIAKEDGERRAETTAGEIKLTTPSTATAAGLSESAPDKLPGGSKADGDPVPAAAAAAQAAAEAFALDGAAKGGCNPPQPKAPCALNNHWNGTRCISQQELEAIAKATGSPAWNNEQWRVYVFQALQKKKLMSAALPASIAAIEPELVARGAGIQRNSALEIRGRLFLPTGDPARPWDRVADVVQGDGWCDAWGWAPR